jgi:hypothetical protein
MKKIITFTLASLFIFSCSSEEKKADAKEKKEEAPKNETKDEVSETPDEPKEEIRKVDTKAYYGSFFKVDYPSDFIASPDGPTDTYPESEKEYVSTDEATFVSPNGDMEFFVFSPQWGGSTNYTEALKTEKITSEKTDEKQTEYNGLVKTTWITFEPTDKSYMRACVIKETENTKMVFGIKYKNMDVYKLYKPEYLAFKKSLVQYAD